MKLTIEAETAMELQHKVLALAALFTAGAAVGSLVNTEVELPYGSFEDEQVEISSPKDDTVVEKKTPAKKKTRKPKAEVIHTPMELPAEEVTDATNDATPATPTFDEVEEEKSAISISDIRNAVAPESASPESVMATKESAMEALTKLNGEKGIVVARSVLSKFQVSRFAELKEESYGPFVAACAEALKAA